LAGYNPSSPFEQKYEYDSSLKKTYNNKSLIGQFPKVLSYNNYPSLNQQLPQQDIKTFLNFDNLYMNDSIREKEFNKSNFNLKSNNFNIQDQFRNVTKHGNKNSYNNSTIPNINNNLSLLDQINFLEEKRYSANIEAKNYHPRGFLQDDYFDHKRTILRKKNGYLETLKPFEERSVRIIR